MSYKLLCSIVECLKLKTVGVPLSITGSQQQIRCRRPNEPKLRTPYWYKQQQLSEYQESLTDVNETFLTKIAMENFELSVPPCHTKSPLKTEPVERKEWKPGYSRTGLIGINLGCFPHWFKDGTRTRVALIQVLENHVINYIPPGTIDIRPYARRYAEHTKGMGNLVVGAITDNPEKYTREYCNIFRKSGVLPKKVLTKFPIHPDARIDLGTPLYAGHFQVGDIVDITGKTRYKGFQGVMKRWGFHGMPATHGQTKTHRRPGNIGAGGEKSRVWPGKKMPGHVGNKSKTARCVQIVRINHKLNILYIRGTIPGDVNSIVYVHDTICRPSKVRQKLKVPNTPYFPTYYPEEHPDRPEEEFYERIFNFSEASITFTPEKGEVKKKK